MNVLVEVIDLARAQGDPAVSFLSMAGMASLMLFPIFTYAIVVHFAKAKYRNKTRRYVFEKKTEVEVSGHRVEDQFRERIEETARLWIDDRNDHEPTTRAKEYVVTEEGRPGEVFGPSKDARWY